MKVDKFSTFLTKDKTDYGIKNSLSHQLLCIMCITNKGPSIKYLRTKSRKIDAFSPLVRANKP